MENNDRDTVEKNEDTNITNSEKLLVLPLGEESKKITQVISNDTARQIMELLAEYSMSASDIAGHLNLPLTTIKYNIENLVDAGLIKIEKIKYSEKGRKVKIYGPVRKLIVVVPERTDNASIADLLRKYLGVIFAALFASGLIELLRRSAFRTSLTVKPEYAADSPPGFFTSEQGTGAITGMNNDTVLNKDMIPSITNISEPMQRAVETPPPVSTALETPDLTRGIIESGLQSNPGLWFLLGCLFVILIVLLIDYYRLKKK